jgi:hypothetical protein
VPLPHDWAGLWLRYRLSREGYLALLEHQRGRCAKCHRLPFGDTPLVVDHRESRIWGLLHDRCNRPIDDELVAYLRDPPAFGLGEAFGVIPPEVERRGAERRRRNRLAQRDWRKRRSAEQAEHQAAADRVDGYGEWLAGRLR